MTDAHCHVSCGDPAVREFIVGRDFFGVHPWEILDGVALDIEGLRATLVANPRAGVGEIGLDRLKVRDVPQAMRDAFAAQLRLAFELRRPVVLHGAKCWGQVVDAIRRLAPQAEGWRPAFLFHGFSRSDGLIPEIVRLNGYISVGPAVLNDHAVNYRELVKKIPLDRLLLETDATADGKSVADIGSVLGKTAELRGIPPSELERITDATAECLLRGTSGI